MRTILKFVIMSKITGLFVFLSFSLSVYAQSPTTFEHQTINASINAQKLDSLSILPGSLRCMVRGHNIPDSLFHVDYIAKTIRFSSLVSDTVELIYTRLNADLTADFQRFDSTLIQRKTMDVRFLVDPYSTDVEELFGGKELSKKGSLSRGVSFGNQQNLGINSTLNLELNGKLNDNLNLLASISDANIPIQPEGNTNKLQEFDQVFIQVFNERLKLTAGDFWITKPEGYFLNYRKRAQGISNMYRFVQEKTIIDIQSSVGLSKGKFNRQILQGIENNQGPYRLTGAENEPFIVVLSGTEKVYLDGRLLERGQEFDYIIDYNSAELVFTSRNLITKDLRIVVEFQYSDQSYTRALVQQAAVIEHKKLKSWFNYYQEQDLKNQPLQISLDPLQKNQLALIGDSLQEAQLNTVDSVGYFSNQNLYWMNDSLGFDSVLVFTSHPDSARYRANFKFVGDQKGNYVLDKTTAFGKVYRWVAPSGGISQGQFAPVQLIITPKRRRLVSWGMQHKINEQWEILDEFSASENNLNLFSNTDKGNDWGWANRTKISRKQQNISLLKSTSDAEVELISRDFTPIEPFRKVEFDRDWNTRNKSFVGLQRYVVVSQKLEHSKAGMVLFQAQHYGISQAFSANRMFSEGRLNTKLIRANWDASALKSRLPQNTSFIRHRADIVLKLRKLQIGFKDDQEFNRRDTVMGLLSQSYGFFDYQVYVENKDSSQQRGRLFFRDRFDYRPSQLGFKAAAQGTSVGGEFFHQSGKGQKLTAIVAFRNLKSLDSSLINISPDQSLVGRIEYGFRGLKGALTFETFYEIGSGLEQKRSFVYLEVNAGQGVYTWIDYNNDGVKDLNEFELAAFIDQANYIRVFNPSSEYQKTFNNEFNQSLFWRPELLWNKKKGILKGFSLFSNQLRWRSTTKMNQWSAENLLNPFWTNLQSNDLISSNYNFRNTLFFMRTSSIFNGHYIISKTLSKVLLANGYDGRSLEFQELMFRWNVKPTFSIRSENQRGVKSNKVDYTQGRNYTISYYYASLELAYQPSASYRFAINGRSTRKNNALDFGGEESQSRELGFTSKINSVNKGSVQVDLKYLNLTFTGQEQSAVAFEMLESLRPGSNATWSITWQRNLGKNLQLNLVYSGRKSTLRSAVHNGSMELRAYF